MLRSKILACAALLAAMLIVTAVALAAKPSDGSFQDKKQDVMLTVKGGKITGIAGGYGNKCQLIPISDRKTVPVVNGKFSYSGPIKNVVKEKAGTLTLKGTFVSATKATGSYRFVHKSCTSKKDFSIKKVK